VDFYVGLETKKIKIMPTGTPNNGLPNKSWFKKGHPFCSGGEKGWFKKSNHGYWLNKKRSKKDRKKISDGHIGIMSGDKHWNWKGGVSFLRNGKYSLVERLRKSTKYKKWRKMVLKRDNNICQECGAVGSKLETHHIKSFSKLLKTNNIQSYQQALLCDILWDINNGETLCIECHKKTPNYTNRIVIMGRDGRWEKI